jgi:AGCS family alanine or glycine:cation symporter
MAIPNLICMLFLSSEVARDMKAFQEIIRAEREQKQ